MSDNLRDEMRRALKEAWRDRAMSVSFDVTWRAMTDAAWEVVGPELDRLLVEVKRLKRQERGQTTAAMTAWRAADVSRGRVKAVEAECDGLRARLAKVERVHHEVDVPNSAWSTTAADGMRSGGSTFVKGCSCGAVYCPTLAALASVPEPSDSEPAPDADREAGERA